MRSNSRISWLWLPLAFVLGGLLIPHLRVTWSGPSALATPAPEVDVSTIPPAEIYARAAAVAGPAVVNIDTEKRVRVRGFFDDEFYDGPRYRRVAGSGSGVIVSAQGDIVTNAHVVEGADAIMVTLSDGRQFKGRVIGSDYSTDVALIHVDGDKLPVAKLGTSKGLLPGQITVAIGNPLGFRWTVTQGIVSALGRPIKLGDRIYENLIQTDTPINPGNSGGALVDREGRVIGINTLVMEANGVGFAIPIDTAIRIADELRKFGKVKRPWTGLYAGPVTRNIQAYFELPSREGAFVEGIVPGSPADEAGLKPGDVVLEFDGKKVRSEDDLRKLTEGAKIGQKVTIRAVRGTAELVLKEAP